MREVCRGCFNSNMLVWSQFSVQFHNFRCDIAADVIASFWCLREIFVPVFSIVICGMEFEMHPLRTFQIK